MNFLEKLKLRFRYLCSFLFPWLVEQRIGGISPFLEVWLIDGRYQLNTKKANYSFGNLHLVFVHTFQKRKVKDKHPKNILMLGFGSGSVASILQEEYALDCNITAIEKDPVVIELGHKYFKINRFKNLELICDDAYTYVQKCDEKFDLIVVDLFIDLEVPSCFFDTVFIQSLSGLLTADGTLFYNTIPRSDETLSQTRLLENELILNFKNVESDCLTIDGTGNQVFFCSE